VVKDLPLRNYRGKDTRLRPHMLDPTTRTRHIIWGWDWFMYRYRNNPRLRAAHLLDATLGRYRQGGG
jgi:hypothetical protein